MAKKPVANAPGGEGSQQPESAPSAPSDPKEGDAPGAKPASPLAELFGLDRTAATDEQIQDVVNRHVAHLVQQAPGFRGRNVLVLYDGQSIDRSDSNRIYQALSRVDRDKPLLLVLRSPGGDIAAAYFIGKLCREYTKATFEVVVPREAKSAATLVCCGADAIHMGSLSELGPIDPQFGGMPALAVKHSLEHLAEIVARHPGAKDMLSEYLAKSLPVNIVGHFERAAGSAAQYAERLLSGRVKSLGSVANAEIARRLVYEYKDHGFAIDAREAISIFGDAMVKTNTEQYAGANQLYEELDLIEFIVRSTFKRKMWFTGGPSTGCQVVQQREETQSA